MKSNVLRSGSTGNDQIFAENVLLVAGSGGRNHILKMLLRNWLTIEPTTSISTSTSTSTSSSSLTVTREEGETKQKTKETNAKNRNSSPPASVIRVRLKKLKNLALNGLCGTRTTYDAVKQRYKIILDNKTIKQKGYVNVKDENIEIIKNVNRKDDDKKKEKQWLCNLINKSSVIWRAASGGHLEALQLLLNVVPGVNVNIAIANGSTPLQASCANGHIDIVKLLLAQNKININSRRNDGSTNLYIACQKGCLNVVDALLDANGLLPNLARHDGMTPFMVAAQAGYLEIVKIMCTKAKNLSVNQTDNEGETALAYACRTGHANVANYLILNGIQIDVNKTWNLLRIVAVQGHVDCCKVLLSHRDIDINQRHVLHGVTPLMLAVMKERVEMVRYLLQQPNIDTSLSINGQNSFDLAQANKNKEIIQLFHEHMNNENSETKETNQPFIRTNEDRKELQTDKKCANRHGLIGFKTPRDGFGCDVCSNSIPTDTVMYGCNECNYDICVSCEENTLGERKQDDDKEEEEEDEDEEDDDMDLAMALSMSMNKET